MDAATLGSLKAHALVLLQSCLVPVPGRHTGQEVSWVENLLSSDPGLFLELFGKHLAPGHLSAFQDLAATDGSVKHFLGVLCPHPADPRRMRNRRMQAAKRLIDAQDPHFSIDSIAERDLALFQSVMGPYAATCRQSVLADDDKDAGSSGASAATRSPTHLLSSMLLAAGDTEASAGGRRQGRASAQFRSQCGGFTSAVERQRGRGGEVPWAEPSPGPSPGGARWGASEQEAEEEDGQQQQGSATGGACAPEGVSLPALPQEGGDATGSQALLTQERMDALDAVEGGQGPESESEEEGEGGFEVRLERLRRLAVQRFVRGADAGSFGYASVDHNAAYDVSVEATRDAEDAWFSG